MLNENTHILSFVIPIKDEAETIKDLVEAIINELKKLSYIPDIVLVDDGSKDKSWAIMCELAKTHKGKVSAIKLRRNFGKAIALESGFREVKGEIVFTMDADLQDDPKEIPKFLEALNSGFDMVSGWKKKRYDPIMKTTPSRLFNFITAKLTGITLHDFNCGFKAYRKDVIGSFNLYGELHRFIPVLANEYGFTVGEIEVMHHPRKYGVSKFGNERYLRGFVDLITVIATTRWLRKPGHFFGGIGLLTGFIGGAILVYLFILWLMGLGPIGNRPLLTFGVLLSIASLQMISLGIIAEFFIKINKSNDPNDFIVERYREE